jgi:hypothetical protein
MRHDEPNFGQGSQKINYRYGLRGFRYLQLLFDARFDARPKRLCRIQNGQSLARRWV